MFEKVRRIAPALVIIAVVGVVVGVLASACSPSPTEPQSALPTRSILYVTYYFLPG